MKNKNMFKIDFKEARENAGLQIPIVEKIARGIGYDIDVFAIENNKIKPSDADISLLMSIYGQNNDNNGYKF